MLGPFNEGEAPFDRDNGGRAKQEKSSGKEIMHRLWYIVISVTTTTKTKEMRQKSLSNRFQITMSADADDD